MRKLNFLLFFFFFVFGNSCTLQNAFHKNLIPCKKATTREIFTKLVEAVLSEYMFIYEKDLNSGVLVAETSSDYFYGSEVYTSYKWEFSMKQDTIIAIAKRIKQKKSNVHKYLVLRVEITLGDDTDNEISVYWNIRKTIEQFCGNPFIIQISPKKKHIDYIY